MAKWFHPKHDPAGSTLTMTQWLHPKHPVVLTEWPVYPRQVWMYAGSFLLRPTLLLQSWPHDSDCSFRDCLRHKRNCIYIYF